MRMCCIAGICDSGLSLPPAAAYLFTPLGLAPGTWWAAALQALPLQIFMLIAIGTGTQLAALGEAVMDGRGAPAVPQEGEIDR